MNSSLSMVSGGEKIVSVRTARIAFLLSVALLVMFPHRLPAPIFETPEKPPSKPGTSVNADGSRTVYEIDSTHHTAVATVTERNGKLREKIRYELDGAGRFTSRMIFDPDGKLRSKSLYKYDKAGHVLEETQLGQDGAVLHKIAYSYDQTGKQTGHSVFDGNGKPARAHAEFEGSAPGG
jgi:hypothetical protein